jgi:hypothetical protein
LQFQYSRGNDSCEGSKLIEYYCKETGAYVHTFRDCPDGCENGACIKGDKYFEAKEANCQDSEAGKSWAEMIAVAGVVSYAGEDYYDFCESSHSLREYHCDINFGLLKETRVRCSNGCENGFCRQEPLEIEKIVESSPLEDELILNEESLDIEKGSLEKEESSLDFSKTCLDTDFGLNYFEKGSVIFSEEYYNDFCIEGLENKLIEYFCSEDEPSAFVYSCEFGCNEGKCTEITTSQDNSGSSSDELSEEELSSCSELGGIICSENQECSGVLIKEGINLNLNEICCLGTCSDKENYFGTNCNGCLFEGECYSYGFVFNNYYCSPDGNRFLRKKSLGKLCSENFECMSGFCEQGKCVESIEVETKEECLFGCFYNERCYNVGSRVNGDYCSERLSFVSQVMDGKDCLDNYECISNICLENECISLNLFQKFVAWLKGSFFFSG